MYNFTLLEAPKDSLAENSDVQELFGKMIGIRCQTYGKYYNAIPLGPEDLVSHHLIISEKKSGNILIGGSFISLEECQKHSIELPIQKMCDQHRDTIGKDLCDKLNSDDNPWYFSRMIISNHISRRKRVTPEFQHALFAIFAYALKKYEITDAYATTVKSNGATHILEKVGFKKLYDQPVLLPDLQNDAYVVKYSGEMTDFCQNCYKEAADMIDTMTVMGR